MNFVSLQENLRKLLRRRVEAGEFTGMELAGRTGFTQAHISNFLNRKRGLKLAALDKVLRAVGLSLYDLLDPHELARFAPVAAGADADYVDVPLVHGRAAAASEVIVRDEAREVWKVRRELLKRLRPEPAAPSRRAWTRFVLLEADARDGLSMWPRLAPGALLLVDRHYTTLNPYRKNGRNLYAVRRGDSCVVRYVELCAGSESGGTALLLLRPHNADYPVEALPIEEGRTPAELLVGRIAHIAVEA